MNTEVVSMLRMVSLTIRNYKYFDDVTLNLAQATVLVGRNNVGKTSALQALRLWYAAITEWRCADIDDGGSLVSLEQLAFCNVLSTNDLWFNCLFLEHYYDFKAVSLAEPIELIARFTSETDDTFEVAARFHYVNEQTLRCIVEHSEGKGLEDSFAKHLIYLVPLRQISTSEVLVDREHLDAALSRGNGYQHLRSMCYHIFSDHPKDWNGLRSMICSDVGWLVSDPKYDQDTRQVCLTYRRERNSPRLDVSSVGTGLQQMLYYRAATVYAPNSLILIDDVETGFAVCNQHHIFTRLQKSALNLNSQIIATTNSKPVISDTRRNTAAVEVLGLKSGAAASNGDPFKVALELDFRLLSKVREKGWILYLEGRSDLIILKAFAARLNHLAHAALESALVQYVSATPVATRRKFSDLKIAHPHIEGFALFDRMELLGDPPEGLKEVTWRRYEIENYLCSPEALIAWANMYHASGKIRPEYNAEVIITEAMSETLREIGCTSSNIESLCDIKVSDFYLCKVFQRFSERAGCRVYRCRDKSHYAELVQFMPEDQIDDEVKHVLDAIAHTATDHGVVVGAARK